MSPYTVQAVIVDTATGETLEAETIAGADTQTAAGQILRDAVAASDRAQLAQPALFADH